MATDTGALDIGACVNSAGSAIGMPQLCADWIPNQIFWLFVSLALIYFVLSRIALPRIATVLASRQGGIRSDLAVAEELKQKALMAEELYTETLIKARTEAGRIVAAAKTELQAELKHAIVAADQKISIQTQKSEAKISEIRAGALEAVASVAKDTAKEIVAAMGGKADARSITAAVTARIKG
jgi:F-type H+-transporting ATPase subunit b